MRSGSRTTRTIAVEDEDPASSGRRWRRSGCWPRPNVSFPRGLTLLVGFGARRYAVIDVGTNSVKFVLGERRRTASWRAPRRPVRGDAPRPGAGASDGSIRKRSSGRPTRSRTWSTRRGSHGVEEIAAAGTAGMRVADNTDELRRPCASGAASRSRWSTARRRRGSRTSPRSPGLDAVDGSLVVFETGRRQHAVHLRSRRQDRRSVQRRRRRRTVTEHFGLDDAVDEDGSPRPSTPSRATSRRSTAGRRPTRSSGWAAP